MSKQKVSDIIIEVLEQAGVQRCYGIVGDTLNHVTDSMSKSSIEWIHVRHEEVGGFAAGTDALLSGHLTACAGSCGRVVCILLMVCMSRIAIAPRSF